ncbi:alkaline phosphatase family protein [Pigmentibacter ruber]|nr:hypothetical protein GTC16762_00330 [Pigmentibacter ruber]
MIVKFFSNISKIFIISNIVISCQTIQKNNEKTSNKENQRNNVILFVWDGLRPDVLSDPKAHNLIKNLRYIANNGVEFKDNHSAYPTFTMNNAQAFATGSYAGKSGFFGNYIYEPWRAQKIYGDASNANGTNITSTFLSPIFTEDYKILQALDQPYTGFEKLNEPLVQVSTLLESAHSSGLVTAVVGKSGPAFFQDYKAKGYILDEKHVWPLSLSQELQNNNFKLPKLTSIAYPGKEFKLAANNGDPTASEPLILLENSEDVTDPSQAKTSPFNKKNEYMADIFLNYILPNKLPNLSVVWLRNPDSTQHEYGPGSEPYYDALKSNDIVLGKIFSKLKELNLLDKTNIIIVSDHAHSNILATKREDSEGYPQLVYPLHEIKNGKILSKTNSQKKFDLEKNKKLLVTTGYSTSGIVRTADLITKANLKTSQGNKIAAFDGAGCSFNSPMAGVLNEDGSINTSSEGYNNADGSCVDKNNKNSAYTSPAYFVPRNLSNSDGIEKVVIAANGGTDYVYIPNHNQQVVEALANFFQRRQEYSAIFIDDKRYTGIDKELAGTLPLSFIKLENQYGKNPDMVISLTHNPNVVVNGLPGTEFDSTDGYGQRGDHGSFGRTDVNNILLAIGPNFNSHMKNYLPTGNVDVAPTIAKILNLKLLNTDGRVMHEVLKQSNISANDYKVSHLQITSNPKCNLEIYEPTTHPINFNSDAKNKFIDPEINSFHTELNTKILETSNKEKYIYFDSAEGKRSKECPKVTFKELN